MTGVDYLILAVLGISGLTSLMRGFIAEVMSLMVWGVALWISARFSGVIASEFLSSIEQPAVRLASSYIGLFLLVLMLGGLVTWMIRKMVAKSGMTSTDRTLGFGFGLARGLLMVFSAVLVAGFTKIPQEPWWQQSSLIPVMASGARAVSEYLPANARQYLHFPAVGALSAAPAEASAEKIATPESSAARSATPTPTPTAKGK
jgi:membrane protein required for colicin V production